MIVARRKSYLNTVLALFCLLFVIVGVMLSKQISAEEAPEFWSWANAAPTVFSSNAVAGDDAGGCAGSYQTVEISGYTDLKSTCLSFGEMARFGYYPDVTVFRYAVGFKFDSTMYKFNGPCNSNDDCMYLPDTDVLVARRYCGPFCKRLEVYKNFSSRLKSVIIPGVVSRLEYDFDVSNPDFVFKSGENTIWGIGGMSASDNGKWLAVEIRQRGIGLLNIDTLKMKEVSDLSFYYGYGRDPTVELAVDDDGQHIAVVGKNAGLDVFDITSECGDDSSYDADRGHIGMSRPYCNKASIDTNGFIPHFKYALHPEFNDDGAELRFFASSYVFAEPQRLVTLRANGYNPPRLDYLALGDSYSSGEGDDESHYLNGTNDEYENCHVSDRSYPFLLAREFGIGGDSMASVACSGATTKDVDWNDSDYKGQKGRLKMNASVTDTEVTLAKIYALYNFVPGRIYQRQFVDYYKPKVITVGIGGNDVQLIQKLESCFSPTTCNWASDASKKEQVANEIKGQFSNLVETYEKFTSDSPDSKVYVVGYPQIISDGDNCGRLGDLLDRVERHYMIESIHYLNQVIASAAKSAGAKYIDIEDAYGDNVICGSGDQNMVNTVEFGGLEEYINNFRYYKLIHSEGFHPNNLGHQKDAGAIINEVGNIVTYDYCQNGRVVCPDKTVLPPEPPGYWYTDGLRYTPMLFYVDFIPDVVTDGLLDVVVELDSSSFKPNSTVDIEVYSDMVSLGQFDVADDGSLNAALHLPENLEEGYHTMFIHGLSYSGQAIDLYKIFIYQKLEVPDETQADNDVLDEIVDEANDSQPEDSAIEMPDSPSEGQVIVGDEQDVVNRDNDELAISSDVQALTPNKAVAVSQSLEKDQSVKGISTVNSNIERNNPIDSNFIGATLVVLLTSVFALFAVKSLMRRF
ncbi:MAG: SGNH/GDSL hydrolase family protein [Candidatus Saccharimonadales bacterium]